MSTIARSGTGPRLLSRWNADDGSRPSTRLDRFVLGLIQRHVGTPPIQFVLWDGFALQAHAPVGALRFASRRALFAVAWNPDLYFGEAYMAGAVEIRGDILAVLEALYRGAGLGSGPSRWRPARPNGADTARANVHHHYDLGNAFYRHWLDREMVYTCAYFPTPDASLEDAQRAKMDLVCRKLWLRPGERVIEAGCGWGALALFMAREYGVAVRAFNVSHEQIAWARDRAKAEGLAGRVEFVEDDYRSVRGSCDVFVSVGMLEHVGTADYPTLGRVMDRVLTDRGRGLLHFIGRDRPAPLSPWIRRRIFPGAYPPALREVCGQVLEPYAFSVLDVENLRLHYARTLAHWRQRFERHTESIAADFDESFVRCWRLYLAGSEAAFTTGTMQLFQIVFARGGSNALPWTRVSG